MPAIRRTFVNPDQRGITRPADGNNDGTSLPDIGAVEAGVLVTNTNDAGAGSLRQAIADANSTAANDEIRFSTLFDAPQTITLTSGELSIAGGGVVIINGPGRDRLTLSGNDQSRAFAVNSGSNATIRGLRISGGPKQLRTPSEEGCLNSDGSNLTLSNVLVSGNTTRDGGGLFSSATMILEDSIVESNRALDGNGGAIASSGGTLIVNNSILRNNEGDDGGAIDNTGTLTVRNSTISGNTARAGGGGIDHSTGNASITNSVIYNNTAQNGGGGIYNRGNSLYVANTTVSGNTATTGAGGGILTIQSSTSLLNASIAFNSANSGGGLGNGTGSTVISKNSIVAKNLAAATGPDISGGLVSQGYNLIGNAADSQISGDTAGQIVGADPLLLPLAENGGSGRTHALAPTSLAVDAGDPIKRSAADQRGFNRSTDGDGNGTARTDVGAFELGSLVSNTNNAGGGSIRQALIDARDSGREDEIRLSPLFDRAADNSTGK